MDNFNELVREADRCAAKMQPTKARQLYEEARSLKLRGSPFATIACVICLLNYASTFNSRNQKKDELLAEAQSRLSQLYDDKEIVYSQLQWTKEKFFATLVDLLTKLHALMPGEHEDRQLIQKRIGFCKAALPEQVESELELSPLRRRKVSRDFPGRSRSPAMIFAGFLVLGLAAVGVIALYRRFIVRAS
jgi:hypothetical protein